MHTLKRTGRTAGFLYLLVILLGPFVLIYVPNRLFVPGDASATVSNILAHETLFRMHIVAGIVVELLFISVVLVLFQLLKGVNRTLATVMVITILLDAPLAFLSVANEVATLAMAKGAGYLSALEKPQRDAIAALLINADRESIYVSELFWGLWLLPLAVLIHRSGFVARWLGVWIGVNGAAYVVLAFIGIIRPTYYDSALRVATPLLFGEVALMVWLLRVGARVRDDADTRLGRHAAAAA